MDLRSLGAGLRVKEGVDGLPLASMENDLAGKCHLGVLPNGNGGSSLI